MSKLRRDKKERILFTGESQRKDGKYEYKYTDAFGVRRSVYSWKLSKSDPLPKGKQNDLSLREKEKLIQKELAEGRVPNGGNMTVVALVEKYVSQKRGVRHNTLANYKFVINILKKEVFGRKRIDTVKKSDAKAWFIKLQNDGRGYSSIHAIRGVIRPAFQLAMDDDLLIKNPFDFELNTVITNDSVTREPLTPTQESAFLDFIKNDETYSKYYDGIFILFKTGLRISEFVGLTINDIDFKNEKIIVDHQLQRTRDMKYIIENTKTANGTRMVPMTTEVADCFRRIIDSRKSPKTEPIVDGYSGFLWLDKNDMPTIALHWEKYLQRICQKYNKVNSSETLKVTPHVCRHTFCTNMARVGMNSAMLQYVMGHSDINITFNVYTHIKFEDAAKEMKKFESKLKSATMERAS